MAKQPVAPPQAKSGPSANLIVTVKDAPSGKGLAGALLEVVGLRGGDKNGKENEVHTDKNGKHVFQDLPADRVWVIKASKKGFGTPTNFAPNTFAEVKIDKPTAGGTEKVELELTSSCTLVVTVKSPKRGIPVAGAEVEVVGLAKKATNAKGVAEIADLPLLKAGTTTPIDLYDVKVRKPGHLPPDLSKTEDQHFVKPKAGQKVDVAANLMGTSKLVVTVKDTGGAAVDDAELEVVGLAGGVGKGLKTNDKGVKDLGELPIFTDVLPAVALTWDVKAFKKDFGPDAKGGPFVEGPARRDPDPIFKPEQDAVVNVSIKMQPATKKAELVFPKAFKVHKQFVNLPADGKKPDQSSKITIKAILKGGKKDEVVFAKVEKADTNSKRNSPLPGFTTGQVKESWCPQGGVRAKMRDDAGKKDCEALIEFECGLAGSDLFTIKLGGDEKCADQEFSIVTWRKIEFKVSHQPGKTSAFSLTTDIMKSVRVELVALPAQSLTVGQGPPNTRSWLGNDLIIGPHNTDFFGGKFTPSTTVPQFHVTICSGITFPQAPGMLKRLASTPGPVVIPTPANAFVWDPPLDGGSFANLVVWADVDGSGNAISGTEHVLPNSSVKALNPTSIQITLDAAAKARIAEGKTIMVGARVKHSIGDLKGLVPTSVDGQIFLVLDPTADHALIHEIGHLLKQAIQTAPPGLNLADHGFTYTGKGHLGPHCHFGYPAPLTVVDFMKPPGNANKATTAKCVMFGDVSNAGNEDGFCDKCKPFIKAVDARAPLRNGGTP